METIQVALVDDHAMFRSGIASLIHNYEGYNVLLQAANGKEFLQKISKKFKPHIVLLDINMPGMDGFKTAEHLRTDFPEIDIIILSMFDDSEKVIAMINLDVKGYLLKDYAETELKNALDKVSAGGNYYPDFVTRHLADKVKEPDKNNNHNGPKLNDRELMFIQLACTELTYKEIAEKMNVSNRTVDGYRDQVFEKLKVKSRTGLVLYAIKHKLVKIDAPAE